MNPGSLTIAGIGPGDRRLLSEQARQAIEQAHTIIGYRPYFRWIEDLAKGKQCLRLPMKHEVRRAELAVQHAYVGEHVCVISSGDAGMYAMAGLVLEKLEEAPAPRPEAQVTPGISSLNAAAALLGAPVAHDFAVISLSELLTPWTTIERRLRAAAEADFATVLFNPKSRKRDWQLGRAAELFLEHRSQQTPVGIVRQAYRPNQHIQRINLDQLPVAEVDMLSIVFIGNSQTRHLQVGMVTPRGYENKAASAQGAGELEET